jgi:hypothetical protein
MMIIEQVHVAYLKMEALKKEAFEKQYAVTGGDGRYSSSPYAPLANAAADWERLSSVWEDENPAPEGKYWAFWHRLSHDTLVEPCTKNVVPLESPVQ